MKAVIENVIENVFIFGVIPLIIWPFNKMFWNLGRFLLLLLSVTVVSVSIFGYLRLSVAGSMSRLCGDGVIISLSSKLDSMFDMTSCSKGQRIFSISRI